MKAKLFKLLPLALFSLAVTTGHAQDSLTPKKESCVRETPVKEQPMTAGYNAPARINVEGCWDFYVTGSFIYWQPRMDGLDLGTYSYSPMSTPGRIFNADFDYKPGFKVGLGMNSDFDDWTIYAEYIWIRSNEHTNHNVPATAASTVAFWNTSIGTYTKASSNWEHHNNILDVILGRAHYAGTKLSFMPFAGVRAYWLGQDYHVSYLLASPVVEAPTKASVDSWALGARMGLQGNWFFTKDFRFMGNVAGSLAYQKLKASFVEADGTGAIQLNLKNHYGQITPNVEGALGFGWGSYFSDKAWHVDLSALYEFHYFWNQNGMRELLQHTGGFGDLMYQGLTITAKLDF